MTKGVTAAIGAIPESAWAPIRYPNAIWDESEQRWISDAEVAEIAYSLHRAPTAPARHRPADRAPGTPAQGGHRAGRAGRAVHRLPHHACFTDSPQPMLDAPRPSAPS
jgi:hypothetical protein